MDDKYTTIRIYHSDKKELDYMGYKRQDYADIVHELVEHEKERRAKNEVEVLAK